MNSKPEAVPEEHHQPQLPVAPEEHHQPQLLLSPPHSLASHFAPALSPVPLCPSGLLRTHPVPPPVSRPECPSASFFSRTSKSLPQPPTRPVPAFRLSSASSTSNQRIASVAGHPLLVRPVSDHTFQSQSEVHVPQQVLSDPHPLRSQTKIDTLANVSDGRAQQLQALRGDEKKELCVDPHANDQLAELKTRMTRAEESIMRMQESIEADENSMRVFRMGQMKINTQIFSFMAEYNEKERRQKNWSEPERPLGADRKADQTPEKRSAGSDSEQDPPVN